MKTIFDIFRNIAVTTLKVTVLSAIISFMATSCNDDVDYDHSIAGIEGEPTVLTLNVDLNPMQSQSRTAPNDEYSNNVRDLWIGIYNVNSGKCTLNEYLEEDKIATPHNRLSLSNLKTQSGNSFIVAVANVGTNYGISDNSELTASVGVASGRGIELKKLLEKADTWEKYKSISHMLNGTSHVDFSENNALAMAGSYCSNENLISHPDSWYDGNGNPESVYIQPTSQTMAGCIHLRRMISYIKFNIAAESEKIQIEPVSWKVYNIPIISYLQERDENSADVSTYFSSRDGYESNHGQSNDYYLFKNEDKLTDADGRSDNSIGKGYSFDFYQMENKQTAIQYQTLENDDYIGVKDYSDREREWKAADDSNLGVYKSLAANSMQSKPGAGDAAVNTGNFASFVTFRLKITYWVKRSDSQPGTETESDIVPAETSGATRRECYADYTVHLGYVNDDASDFNCLRNSKYTYNVKVKSVNNIIVEAYKNGEKQPGVEGNVSDINDDGIIELDAHYCVFNIKLTDAERDGFKWRIEAPYADQVISIYCDDYKDLSDDEKNKIDQFYSWIKFKPTTSQTDLRVYNDGDNNDLWSLADIADPANHKGVNNDGVELYTKGSTDERWYTVFIDEYVYHKDLNGVSTDDDGTERGWLNYVNKDPRKIWLVCNDPQISSDKESQYVSSKYLLAQNSLLTYYSSTNLTPDGTALGIERENETLGLNLAWSSNAYDFAKKDQDNGRYNVWYYFTNKSSTSQTSANGRGWYDIMYDRSSKTIGQNQYIVINQFSRDAISTDQYTDDATTAMIYQPKTIAPKTIDTKNIKTYSPFPSIAEYYEIITVCMTRNRDENGDGVIDVDEMKWYVPTASQYVQIMLGQEVIPLNQRFMDFSKTPYYGYGGNSDSNTKNTRFHFASSDQRVYWAEEGLSTSDWSQTWDLGAWEVRCVRELGTNLKSISSTSDIKSAYTLNGNVFTLEYYQDACKRVPLKTFLPPHDVASSTNKPAYQFEVAEDVCKSTNTTNLDQSYGLSLDNNGLLSGYSESNWQNACDANAICGKYNQATADNRGDWRVPNQIELELMRLGGFLDKIGDTATSDNKQTFLSSTYEHYNAQNNTYQRFFVFFKNRGTVDGTSSRYVRCVRDIIEN